MQGIPNFPRFSAVAACLLLATPYVQAASQCKGLAQEACSADPACAWVNTYMRKDGREVKAYCRNSPGKKSDRQSSMPAAKSKTGDKG